MYLETVGEHQGNRVSSSSSSNNKKYVQEILTSIRESQLERTAECLLQAEDLS